MSIRKDELGVEIEVGDIIGSVTKEGRLRIGIVTSIIQTSGYVRMKWAYEGPVYAHEEGAPMIERKSTRIKRDENGNVVYEAGQSNLPPRYGYSSYRRPEYEEYTYLDKDYTKVGSKWKWAFGQAAWHMVVVLRKHDSPGIAPAKLVGLMNLDYDAATPELGDA